ncbi:hypothetical protein ASF15_20225 [Pseudomonas sp. Leaf83]|nr:hypothetical protein ASF15_20225 [Pseudomonas sp. Leaf83]
MESLMNAFDARICALREVIEISETALSIIDRASLFSATRFLLKDICKDQHPRSYICEKANNVGVHLSASLRFEDDQGLSLRSHRKAVLIDLSSLESALSHARQHLTRSFSSSTKVPTLNRPEFRRHF